MSTANSKNKARYLVLVCFGSKHAKLKVFEPQIREWSTEPVWRESGGGRDHSSL